MADKRKGYSPEVARMAIEAYKTKRGSFREIASASGMSTSTLYRLTTGEVAIDDRRVGAKPILSRAAEAGLIKAIVFMNLRSVGMTKEEVFEAAKALAEEERCTFKGEDGLPTKHWWDGFRKRAAESGTPISLRIPRNLSRSRATSGSDSRLRAFFQLIHERVAEHGLDPSRDFIDLDETQVVLDPTQKRVAVVCGTKRVHKLTGIYAWGAWSSYYDGCCHCIRWYSSAPYIYLPGKISVA